MVCSCAVLACTAKVNASVAGACRRRASAISLQPQWVAMSGTHVGSGTSTTGLPHHPQLRMTGGSGKSSEVRCRSRGPPAFSLCCEVKASGGRVPSTHCFFFGGSSATASSTRRQQQGSEPWATTVRDIDVVALSIQLAGVVRGCCSGAGSTGVMGGSSVASLTFDLDIGIRLSGVVRGHCSGALPGSAYWLWCGCSPPGRALGLQLCCFPPNRPSWPNVHTVWGGGHGHILPLLGRHGWCRHLLAIVVSFRNLPGLLGGIPCPQLEGALCTEEVLLLWVSMFVVVGEVVSVVEALRRCHTRSALPVAGWLPSPGWTSALSVPSGDSGCTCTPIHTGRRRKASVIIEGHPHLVTRIDLGQGVWGSGLGYLLMGASALALQATSGICQQWRVNNGLINQHRVIEKQMMDYNWRQAWATAAAAHLRQVDPW